MRLRKYRAWLRHEERMVEWDSLHLETVKDDDTEEVSFMLWVGDDEGATSVSPLEKQDSSLWNLWVVALPQEREKTYILETS